MKTALLPNLNKWSIAYSPYVDTLHAYDKEVSKRENNKLLERETKKYYILLDSKTLEPVLFEMKTASQYLTDIANMSKKDIIKAIEGYINATK